MIPFLRSTGGNFHDAIILVEELAVKVKFPGDPVGTAIRERKIIQYIINILSR